MRFAAIASLVILGLATVGVSAAKTPRPATVTGQISVLKLKTIRVDGTRTLTCRITGASPNVRLRGFVLGSKAKITCRQGVLRAIARPPKAAAPGTPPTLTPAPEQPTPSDSTSVSKPDPAPGTGPGAPAVNPALSLVGRGNISAVGGTSITIGTSATCGFNASSPSVAGFKVGDRVDYQCVAGILTKISFSID